MTDKEIEVLFKSIDNFEPFIKKVEERQDLKLNNDVELKFSSHNNTVYINLSGKMVILENSAFLKIINELTVEKISRDRHELLRRNKISEEGLRHEIFDLGDNRYKIHKEYVEYMYWSSDIASGHGTYLKKLVDLMRVFNRDNNILFIDEKEIKTKYELINFLKSYGFKYIEKDSKLK